MGSTTLNVAFVTETCCWKECGITFAFTREFYNRVRNDHSWWYCPRGHQQHYNGKTDAQKLEDSRARETALQDQLRAAIRDAETTRVALLRDRQRFANGVCPCCNRSFENVRRHMSTQHPDYDVTKIEGLKFRCSCGGSFETLKGLRIHQSRRRGDDWDDPKTSKHRTWGGSHLTEVGA